MKCCCGLEGVRSDRLRLFLLVVHLFVEKKEFNSERCGVSAEQTME